MIGRLLRSEDFERVLGTRSRVSSLHFAVHHLAGGPARHGGLAKPAGRELSTGRIDASTLPVDDLTPTLPSDAPESRFERLWIGTVVPKRHARRAVTRSLLKRQMHQAVEGHGADLPAGIWVLRLRAPFDRAEFPSAASEALKSCASSELAQLLDAAVARARSGGGVSHRTPAAGRNR